MPTLSLKKIFTAIIGIIVLLHLRDILRVFQSVYAWLGESLEGLNSFSEGAQTAIAFCLILLAVVLTLRIFNK
jgi:hypothetical protein